MGDNEVTGVMSLYNGLVLNDSYLPVEIVVKIFDKVGNDDLFNLQMVCKRWHHLIGKFIWPRRAGVVFDRQFPYREDVPWTVYQAFTHVSFNRNLVKNYTGDEGFVNWTAYTADPEMVHPSLRNENFPWNAPPHPDDPIFRGNENHYFFSGNFYKYQEIDLSGAGYTTNFLNVMQPPIEISVWVTGKEGSTYRVGMFLLDGKCNKLDKYYYMITSFERLPYEWHKVSYVFKNYGPGATAIRYCDMARHCCRVTGVSIKVLTPETLPSNYADAAPDIISNFKHWHRKAEETFKISVPLKTNIPCEVYWLMSKINMDANLVQNHSGANDLDHWRMDEEDSDSLWEIEDALVNNPNFPKTQEFRKQRYYFVCGESARYQNIIFREKGISSKILDVLQPPIEVTVWYSCNNENDYKCYATLFKGVIPRYKRSRGSVLKYANHTRGWCKATRIFTNYGSGLTSVRIYDYGTCGETKVARMSVKLLLPDHLPNNFEAAFL